MTLMRTSWLRSGLRKTSRAPWDATARLCAETLAGIADPLFPALASARIRPPAEVARATLAGMLEPLESPLAAEPLPRWLLPHQADAVLRARGILARFGGVLVADGVGLGKTYIGLALIALERSHGGGAVAFVPAAMLAEWRDAADRVGVPLAVHSHTMLARRIPSPPERCTLVLVDEAHAFRNPRTLRYDALARLTAGRRVALLSATPLNNTPGDLAALIHLFAPRDRFREFGVADLGRALRDAATSASLALGAVSVCRTRRLVEERFPDLRRAFPRRSLHPPATYDLARCYGGEMASLLEELSRIAPDSPAAERGTALLHVGLLRRMESSRAALRRSLARQRALLDEIARAAEQGVTLGRADIRAAWAGEGDEAQLALWPLLAAPGGNLRMEGLAPARAAIERALALTDASSGSPDAKLDALEHLLAGPLRGVRTIVFTEYRDTALYLLRRLRRSRRVLCVVGNIAHAGTTVLSRREALDAFSPNSRGRMSNPLLQADVLIATDVLSEGLNLQDAGAVVSYDLPWNPVRVMQRVGRIERLGSPHATIQVAHLVPSHGLDTLTSVLRVLKRKLAETQSDIGAEPDPLASLWWVGDDAPSLERLEQEAWRRVAPFEARERWRALVGPACPARGAPLLAAAIVDDGLPALGVLLALEWPGGIRVPLPFVLETGGRARLDGPALGELAARAIGGRPLPCDAGLFTSALAAALPEARACMLSLSAARRGTDEPGPGRVAALDLLGRAAAQAHRARADDTDIAASIDLLARDLPAGLDRLIGRLAQDSGSPLELARRIREVHAASAIPPAPPLDRAPRLVLVAAFVLATSCPSD